MLEKEVEKKLRLQIRALGGFCLKLLCPGFTGMPDRMILLPGGTVCFAELKRPGKKERPRQLYVQSVLRRLGLTVFSAVDSPEKIAEVIDYCNGRVNR